MSHIPLIELTRNGTLECQHLGTVAVVNRAGRVLAQAGDPHWLCFTRSTLKALQALPFMQAEGPQHFGFSDAQVALMCASHNGEDMHVEQVQGMLDRTGLSTRALQCGCHLPLRFTYTDTPVPDGLEFDERHNNCSGKHAGFLAWCVQHGASTADYIDPKHPLQQAIRRDVARATGLTEQDLVMGTDGCSAPNYALPLSRLAQAYARLASGMQDSEFGASFERLGRAMTTHPDLVSGTGRNDLAFMQAGRGDWVSKVGADGVQVIASRSRDEAIAVKILDGNKPALFAAVVEAMAQREWLDDAQRAEMEAWRSANIINARGLQVGRRTAVFNLNAPSH